MKKDEQQNGIKEGMKEEKRAHHRENWSEKSTRSIVKVDPFPSRQLVTPPTAGAHRDAGKLASEIRRRPTPSIASSIPSKSDRRCKKMKKKKQKKKHPMFPYMNSVHLSLYGGVINVVGVTAITGKWAIGEPFNSPWKIRDFPPLSLYLFLLKHIIS